jgi:ketosteroid isomerase-like protein
MDRAEKIACGTNGEVILAGAIIKFQLGMGLILGSGNWFILSKKQSAEYSKTILNQKGGRKMKKKTLLLLAFSAWVYLMSCAVAPVALRDYNPANPDEAAIISVIIAFEESFNKADQNKFLSIVADDARIMHGTQRKIFTKEEYARILPERIKEMGIIKFSNPKIRISRDIATVQAYYEGRVASMQYYFELKKFGDKWLILANSY